jgi:predicted transcriptional regulator
LVTYIFFPLAHLSKAIEKEVIDIEEKVHAILESKFQDWIDAKVIVGDFAKTSTFAYLGVVDSIMLKLVFGNDEKWLKDKLEASWTVLWRGISQQ